MTNTTRKAPSSAKSIAPGIQRNYNEIIEYLDSHWQSRTEKNLSVMKALDKALGNPSKGINALFVAGTNGKGLTINFASTLFKAEGFTTGAFYSPYILTYNEQFAINNELISNKAFTELANEVINTAEMHDIRANSAEILAMMALVYFKQHAVDVALLELRERNAYDPFAICNPKILAITRITDDMIPSQTTPVETIIKDLTGLISAGTHVASADQSKTNLQLMQEETHRLGGVWAMPVRKLAMLPYPFEQLHGRCAALAERICQIYIDNFAQQNTLLAENSFLAKQKGQRGRPTLEAKRHAELNPRKTIDQFWKETAAHLPAHFQILDKEKPSILLDNARNIDALRNLLLGVRLMHYQRPLKGLSFIFGCDKNLVNAEEFLRLLRYFSKKNSANIVFCPIVPSIAGLTEESWDVEQITNDMKSLKIKAKSAQNFADAYNLAKESVDERHGLIVIAGSQSIIAEYWRHKGMKKL